MYVLIFGSKGYIGGVISRAFKDNNSLVKEINSMDKLTRDSIKGVDVFINCAGASNVPASFENPNVDIKKNTMLVQELLEVIRTSDNRSIKFINLSSAAVYGNPQQLPISESNQCNPISPYGYHKKMAEKLLIEYSQCFGLNSLSLRIFSAYGVGQRKMLLWDLHQKILNSNGEITLFGTGNESRDFIHTEDIYRQLILAIENSKFDGEAVNVGNGKEVYTKDIVEIYKKYYPKSFSYQFNGENRPGDPLNWCADISIMRNWGYRNEIEIEQGIENYINWAVCQ
jgi:dTDP-glucose 4,6-dehydratase/UDP-glucose 4-epimerase